MTCNHKEICFTLNIVFSAKSCPHPGRPRNGNVKGLFRFGERVDYTCDECYKLKGPSYRQCQADQQWTDTQPTCERKYRKDCCGSSDSVEVWGGV